MQPDFLDRFSRSTSPIHRLPPRLKALAAALCILSISLTPAGFLPLAAEVPVSQVHLGIGVLLILVAQIAAIPWSYLLLRLAGMTPFILLISLSIPLSRGLESGWPLMSAVLVKGLLSFATVLLLINTTPFDRLAQALVRLGVPQLMVATLSFMYRYHFVLLDELSRMSRARQSRTFRRSRVGPYLQAAGLVGPVMLRSFERGERVHQAMLSRGFDGRFRTLDD